MARTGSTSLLLLSLSLVSGCDSGGDGTKGAGGTAATTGGSGGGAPATGGAATGGTGAGGAPSAKGGSTTGGTAPAVTGGTTNGGGGQAPITGGTSAGGTSAGGTSAGGTSAGGTSAGAPAGGSGGGSADPCAGALFCDDFEDYDKGKSPGAPWAERVNSGTVAVDDAQHVSGSKSVKFTTEAKSSTKTAFLRLKSDSVFPVAGNLFYGRMMVRLESAPTESVHWTLLQATGTVPNQTYRSQYRYGGQHPVTGGSQLMANYETPDSYSGNGPSTDCWVHANMKVLPTAAWVCVEWEFDGPNDAMRFWMNDQALDDLSVNGTGQGCVSQSETYRWTAPNFGELEIGWESYQNDAARTLYIDDLVVSKTRVGCPK
jgi:hypothetical protein